MKGLLGVLRDEPIARRPGAAGPSAGPIVLVVDDSPVILELVGAVLSDRGARVLYARDVEEARSLLLDEPTDFVLTDLQMPGGSGIELLEWVEDRYPDLPGLLMTGSPELAPQGWTGEMLEKPFCFEELWERIARATGCSAVSEGSKLPSLTPSFR